MLKTCMGIIDVLVNGNSYKYDPIKLENTQKLFSVDGRFKITVDLFPFSDCDVVIEVKLKNFTGDSIKSYIESGERLSLISFYRGKSKLSLGVEDEISNVDCEYVDCGLKVIISKHAHLRQIVFGIAWISMSDEENEDIYTWFAADPTLF